MMLSLAVIIPTYNSPGYLEKVLRGYLSQTRFPDELIVADDGSGPETKEVVDAFTCEAPFPVKHVWQEDVGFRAAKIRNEAVKASTASYLVFTDGDCIPHPSFVEDHLCLAQPGWFVQGKRMLVSREASPSFFPGNAFQLFRLWVRGDLKGGHHLLRISGFAVPKDGIRGIRSCNFAVMKDDFIAVNGFNEAFVGWGREDSEFATRLLLYGLKRKDPPFAAVVFHLWHEEYSRASLKDNDMLLRQSMGGNSFHCRHGMVKDPGDEDGTRSD